MMFIALVFDFKLSYSTNRWPTGAVNEDERNRDEGNGDKRNEDECKENWCNVRCTRLV